MAGHADRRRIDDPGGRRRRGLGRVEDLAAPRRGRRRDCGRAGCRGRRAAATTRRDPAARRRPRGRHRRRRAAAPPCRARRPRRTRRGRRRGSPSGRCCGRCCAPPASNTTVFTAPISAASADTSSSSGITASLKGKVTLTPAKPAVRAAASSSGSVRGRGAVDIHQVVVADHAGRRGRVLVQRRRQRLADVRAQQADQQSFAHAAIPPPRKSWAMRGSARMASARILDAGQALLQHQAVVGDGEGGAGVLLDQQDGDAGVAQARQDREDFLDHQRREADRRLVDQHQLGVQQASRARLRAVSAGRPTGSRPGRRPFP